LTKINQEIFKLEGEFSLTPLDNEKIVTKLNKQIFGLRQCFDLVKKKTNPVPRLHHSAGLSKVC